MYFSKSHKEDKKNIDELVKDIKENGYRFSRFEEYVEKCGGYHRLKKKNMNIIMKEIPEVTYSGSFFEVYKIISDNESDKVVERWTWVVGFATIINTAIAIVGFSRSFI